MYPNTEVGGGGLLAVSSRCADISLSSPLETIAFFFLGGGGVAANANQLLRRRMKRHRSKPGMSRFLRAALSSAKVHQAFHPNLLIDDQRAQASRLKASSRLLPPLAGSVLKKPHQPVRGVDVADKSWCSGKCTSQDSYKDAKQAIKHV